MAVDFLYGEQHRRLRQQMQQLPKAEGVSVLKDEAISRLVVAHKLGISVVQDLDVLVETVQVAELQSLGPMIAAPDDEQW